MSRGAFIEQRLSFLFNGLVAVKFMVNIELCYSWNASFGARSLNSCKCVVYFLSLLAVEGNC